MAKIQHVKDGQFNSILKNILIEYSPQKIQVSLIIRPWMLP